MRTSMLIFPLRRDGRLPYHYWERSKMFSSRLLSLERADQSAAGVSGCLAAVGKAISLRGRVDRATVRPRRRGRHLPDRLLGNYAFPAGLDRRVRNWVDRLPNPGVRQHDAPIEVWVSLTGAHPHRGSLARPTALCGSASTER